MITHDTATTQISKYFFWELASSVLFVLPCLFNFLFRIFCRMAEAKISEEYGHWAEQLAERIVAEKKEPFVVASGITTSGPTHLGTLCEFMFPGAVYDFLKREHEAEFVFVADIMDAFDSVPSVWEKHAGKLNPHLGKPLAHVPDPEGCHSSFGEHFLADAVKTMDAFGVKPQILRANELYAQGKYDSYAVLFFKRLEEVKQIVFESSLKQELPKFWSPIMPICEKCGKIATTQVASFEIVGEGRNEDVHYSYSCDKNAKYVSGCGHSGSSKISGHKYKITWRLDWPSRQDFLNVAAEGGGVDHFTRGGSWDTAKEVHSKIFGKSGPVPFKFGFILFQGKKYSKSKGIGMGVADLLRLLPPELIKFALLRPDIQENIDFNPEPVNLLRLFEEFAEASKLNVSEKLSRADRKRAIAFSLSTDKIKWKAQFSDVLLYKQLYGWSKAGELANDADGVNYLRAYIEAWLKEGRVPDDYAFSFTPTKPKTEEDKKHVLAFANALNAQMKAIDVHNLVFSVAEGEGMPASELFKILYGSLINKQKGPKMGKLVEAIGVEKTRQTLSKLCE